jgi:Zn-dependent membrane protease YugP
VFWFGDPTFMLLIPAILFSLYAQYKVSSTFAKFSRVPNRRGMTGAEVASAILSGHGVDASVRDGVAKAALMRVAVEAVPGELSDHYDPRDRTLRLSEPVYGERSIAALAVAAHEAGHAMQHATAYPYLTMRSWVAPVAQFGSWLPMVVIMGGMVLGMWVQALNIAILLYMGVVVFTLVTLPVEINASQRALRTLADGNYLAADEMPAARAVLNAAALTYVAATASAVIMLLRLVLLRNMASDRD